MMRTPILLAATLLAVPVHADGLADVRAALAATRSFSAPFTQTAATGAVERGRVVLARPGRVRFEYDRAPLLVVADGRALTLIDYKVAQVTSWPIRGTPLAVLLDDRLDLARVARVTAEDARALTLEAADPNHPEYGVTTILFARDTEAPGGLRLEGWRVRDAQGNTTRVQLGQIRYNVPIKAADFRFRDPRPRQIPGKG